MPLNSRPEFSPKYARPECKVLVISETIQLTSIKLLQHFLFYVRISERNWNDKIKFKVYYNSKTNIYT